MGEVMALWCCLVIAPSAHLARIDTKQPGEGSLLQVCGFQPLSKLLTVDRRSQFTRLPPLLSIAQRSATMRNKGMKVASVSSVIIIAIILRVRRTGPRRTKHQATNTGSSE